MNGGTPNVVGICNINPGDPPVGPVGPGPVINPPLCYSDSVLNGGTPDSIPSLVMNGGSPNVVGICNINA
jgi:hypothetical protein